MKRALNLICLLVILALAATGCDSQNSETKNDEKIPVETQTVQLGNLVQSIQYNGDIKAELEVRVFSKIPDRIEQFFIDEGDFIQKGKPVAKIIATAIEQSLRQVEAALVAAKAQEANLRVEFERAQRLSRENAMSKQQFDRAKTQYEAFRAQVKQAEAVVNRARSQLADAMVTAPISGIIGKRFYEAGDMANPAIPLVSIVQMNRVKIIFDATEEDLGVLSPGQEAKIFVRSYKNRTFNGVVTKISPVLDPLSRMAKIEVIINNPDNKLKPGMFARVEVVTGVIKDTIVIPRHATIESTTMENINGEDQIVKNYFIFVADSGKAIQKKLEVIYVNHTNIAVSSGVKLGEQLVTQGQNYLRDGVGIVIENREDVLK